VGERTGNIDGAPPAGGPYTAGQEITVPAFTLVNLKSTYKMNKNVDISVIVMNIFQQTVLFPEYIRRDIATIPGDSGSNIYGEVSYKF
jgi:outer membrane receptor for ferrienterochelin and colicin